MKTLKYDEKKLLKQYNEAKFAPFSSYSYNEMVRLEKIFDFIDEQKRELRNQKRREKRNK